jgi:hypothetical protein
MLAKAGEPTTWSAALKVKIGGGTRPVPDPAALASMIQTAGNDISEAARYISSAVAGLAYVDTRRSTNSSSRPGEHREGRR